MTCRFCNAKAVAFLEVGKCLLPICEECKKGQLSGSSPKFIEMRNGDATKESS